MTDEALTTEQLELREWAQDVVSDWAATIAPSHYRYLARRGHLITLRDAILALIASAQGKDGGQRKAIQHAHNFIDEYLGDTDPQDPGHPLLLAAQVLAPFVGDVPSPSKTERTPGTHEICARGPERCSNMYDFQWDDCEQKDCPLMKKDG